jgi:predicted ribonuclease toxin of YeeF-YezG toxin-antitoxin module
MAGAALIKNLPEIGDKLSENIKKVKNIGKYDWGTVRRYFIHIQEVTGRPVLQKQIDKLKDALRNKEYKKLSPEEYQAHKRQYTSARREKMIKDWEENTGQTWPVDEKGNRYQLHHIIEEQYGGEHEWWNAHPAKFPNEHQGGIHGAGSPSRELFK